MARRALKSPETNINTEIILLVLSGILVIIGLAGLLLPMIPGAPLMFAGLWLAAWAEDFEYVGAGMLVALGALALLTYLVDLAAGALGARRYGASPRALTGAAIGTVVGIFFGLPGLILGPFAGAALGELSSRRDMRDASRAGLGALLGFLFGTIAKLAIAFLMLGLFVAARVF